MTEIEIKLEIFKTIANNSLIFVLIVSIYRLKVLQSILMKFTKY